MDVQELKFETPIGKRLALLCAEEGDNGAVSMQLTLKGGMPLTGSLQVDSKVNGMFLFHAVAQSPDGGKQVVPAYLPEDLILFAFGTPKESSIITPKGSGIKIPGLG